MDALAEGERGPPGGKDRWQCLIRAPARQVIAPVEVHGRLDRARWQGHGPGRREVVDVAHVCHDEPALALPLDQGRQLGRGHAGWMHDQEPAIEACPARPVTKLDGGKATDLMSAQVDQPLGLLSKRRQVARGGVRGHRGVRAG